MRSRMFKGLMCALALLLAAVSLIPQPARAEATADYYLSYKKFIAATNADGSRQITFNEVTDEIEKLLAEGVRRYAAGAERDGDDGYYKPFTNSYGFWYETSGFEKKVMGLISGARVNEVELQFSNMKKAVNNGLSVEEVQAQVDALIALLREDANILDEKLGYSAPSGDAEVSGKALSEYTDEELIALEASVEGEMAARGLSSQRSGGGSLVWMYFVAVFTIILREGLEAILIVAAMVAYLIKTNNKRGTRYVYGGALIALAASVVFAFIFQAIINSTGSGIPQEVTEGVTALIAVAVLIYVSNWMISKAEADAWTDYLNNRVSSSAENGKMLALGFASFLAVFREGAEVILFCHEYFQDARSNTSLYLPIFGGIVAGLAVVALIYILIRVYGVKIPLKQFFTITSVFMAVMSIAFLGSGMFELFLDGKLAETIGGWVLQLSGTIPALAWMNGNDVLTFFGIYPTWITLGPQIILAVITVITFAVWIRRNKKRAKAGAKA